MQQILAAYSEAELVGAIVTVSGSRIRFSRSPAARL
jgi:hypothetical protein